MKRRRFDEYAAVPEVTHAFGEGHPAAGTMALHVWGGHPDEVRKFAEEARPTEVSVVLQMHRTAAGGPSWRQVLPGGSLEEIRFEPPPPEARLLEPRRRTVAPGVMHICDRCNHAYSSTVGHRCPTLNYLPPKAEPGEGYDGKPFNHEAGTPWLDAVDRVASALEQAVVDSGIPRSIVRGELPSGEQAYTVQQIEQALRGQHDTTVAVAMRDVRIDVVVVDKIRGGETERAELEHRIERAIRRELLPRPVPNYSDLAAWRWVNDADAALRLRVDGKPFLDLEVYDGELRIEGWPLYDEGVIRIPLQTLRALLDRADAAEATESGTHEGQRRNLRDKGGS